MTHCGCLDPTAAALGLGGGSARVAATQELGMEATAQGIRYLRGAGTLEARHREDPWRGRSQTAAVSGSVMRERMKKTPTSGPGRSVRRRENTRAQCDWSFSEVGPAAAGRGKGGKC